MPINQETILAKCSKYLEYQREDFPNKYKKEDVDKVLQTLAHGEGKCSGLVALWLYWKPEDKADKNLISILEQLSNWDGKKTSLREGANEIGPDGKKINPDGKLAGVFEQFINDVLWAFQHDTPVHKYHQSNLPKIIETVRPEKGLSIAEDFNMTFVFKKNEMIETLEKIMHENRMVRFGSSNHVVGIVKKNNVFYVYDPNDKDRNVEKTFTTIEQLQEHLEIILYQNFWKYNIIMPATIHVFRNENQERLEYPDPKMLIERFLNDTPNRTSNDGFHPLLFATAIGDFTNFPLFIDKGCDVYRADSYGRSVLHLVCTYGELKARQAKKYIQSLLSVSAADLKNLIEILRQEAKGDKSLENEIASLQKLSKASEKEEALSKIIDSLSKIKCDAPLIFDACDSLRESRRLFEAAKLLLAKNANIDYPSISGVTPLMEAAQGHLGIVECLLQSGANPNAANKYGRTPLIYAAKGGHINIVTKVLTEKNVNYPAKDGVTPLMEAAQGGHLDVVKFLLKSGADPNAADVDRWTPLIYAAKGGHSDIVTALLAEPKINESINFANKRGWTPLMLAAAYGHTNIVKSLLDAGGDLDPKNQNGLTALQIAQQNGHPQIVKMIEERMKSNMDRTATLKPAITHQFTLQQDSSNSRTNEDNITHSSPNSRPKQ